MEEVEGGGGDMIRGRGGGVGGVEVMMIGD